MAATLLGLVYSAATNIVLRTINPDDAAGDAYLTAVEQSLPAGMAMATIAKASVDATAATCPRLATLLTAFNALGGVQLVAPQRVAIVDALGKVVDVVMGCPVLVKAHAAPRLATAAGGSVVGPSAVTAVADPTGVAAIGGTHTAAGGFVAPVVSKTGSTSVGTTAGTTP